MIRGTWVVVKPDKPSAGTCGKLVADARGRSVVLAVEYPLAERGVHVQLPRAWVRRLTPEERVAAEHGRWPGRNDPPDR